MRIREERPGDGGGIRTINEAAFRTRAETELVDLLREQAQPRISLVAEQDGFVLGYILFSPVTLEGHPELRIMGLAPMAVHPSRQRLGVGSALVVEGLRRCRELGACAVVVLGHPRYYARFGFRPGSGFGLHCAYEVPAEVFMVQELVPGGLRGCAGRIDYHPAFAEVD